MGDNLELRKRINGQALSIEEEAERPIETDISLRVRQDEVTTVTYYIKEAIMPKEENEEADNEDRGRHQEPNN